MGSGAIHSDSTEGSGNVVHLVLVTSVTEIDRKRSQTKSRKDKTEKPIVPW